MARAAVSGRLTWLVATVKETRDETATARTVTFDVPGWPGHQAGQHVTVKLTAEDGYSTQRDYSIASAPEAGSVEITVQRLDDGEVSPYLVDVLQPGDELELRGPIGGYFVWEASLGGPLVLVGGGSGVVPLRAILRHRVAAGDSTPAQLLYSSRTLDEVIYRDELSRLGEHDGVEVELTLTREWPEDWSGHRGRIDRDLLASTVPSPSAEPLVYICGPTSLVEAVAETLVGLGHAPLRIRTERFGPTGT